MRYHWLKDGKELTNSDDYSGSTTPELVIVGTGPQVRGNYKCRVKYKYGEIISREIYYGKLLILYICLYNIMCLCNNIIPFP